ncbi:endo-1,3(4)-beta-glucanase PWA37_004952 [Arxiozyma heterogenica]|uniref:glucan endo-1,3-beta-D-glucosidase n=1 Tax=Arxiozyma heterogenica TaxID=278026 RepID=A0AAN7ZWS0_9SACH|nr:hypothetical protein RI543_004980 [Kazachstania heterogenica]
MYDRPKFPLPGEQNNLLDTMSTTTTEYQPLPLNLVSSIDPRGILPPKIHALSPPSSTLTLSRGFPIPTNKFYGNLLLPNGQELPLWVHPYSLWYSKHDNSICVSYISAHQRVFDRDNFPPQFYFNPVGIKSIMFSTTLTVSTSISVHNLTHMACQLDLIGSHNQMPLIQFPLVQGTGLITALYKFYPNQSSKICVKSMVGFRSFVRETPQRYKIVLNDNKLWFLYCNDQSLELLMQDPQTIVSNRGIRKDTTIQVTVWESDPNSISLLDQVAGFYPISCQISLLTKLSSSSSSTTSSFDLSGYSFIYSISGESMLNPLCHPVPPKCFIYALPHHMNRISETFLSKYRIPSYLNSTVSGTMTGFITDRLDMNNDNYVHDLDLMKSMSFHPMGFGNNPPIITDNEILQLIHNVATQEISQCDILSESNLDSMYFSGKCLAKYAWILYSTCFIIKDLDLTKKLLKMLQTAFSRFISNNQIIPLNYDTTWKGVISSTNEPMKDFGNSYYNDHHFHYGYFVMTGAIIIKVEQFIYGNSPWYQDMNNRNWIELLIRDYNNPSLNDPWFPQFRSFDWFNGHSWAKGLFESSDGKDEESSSEDVMSIYAIKLWANATSNNNLELITNLQLTILKDSINHYFIYDDSNVTEPPQFILNKCSGILFENKIHHTTYFGNNLEYIQMIHAIPILPISTFIRSSTFVQQEWDQLLKNIVDKLNDGWKGIIMLNMALCDPILAYSFFSNPQFDKKYLDGGQSLTWSLSYCACLSLLLQEQ